MDQIKRIEEMEGILDEAVSALAALEKALDRYHSLQIRIRKLEAYYTGPLWRQDYQDDEMGKLPLDLKRGVLSEDGIYHLLADEKRLRDIWMQEGKK